MVPFFNVLLSTFVTVGPLVLVLIATTVHRLCSVEVPLRRTGHRDRSVLAGDRLWDSEEPLNTSLEKPLLTLSHF